MPSPARYFQAMLQAAFSLAFSSKPNFGTQNLIVFGDCIGGYAHNTSTFVRCSVRIDANNDAFFSLRFVLEERVQLCKRPQMQAASAACPRCLECVRMCFRFSTTITVPEQAESTMRRLRTCSQSRRKR